MPPPKTIIAAGKEAPPDGTVALALDLFLLAPASVRALVASVQDLPTRSRIHAYSEIYDALARGVDIVRGGFGAEPTAIH